MNTLREKFTSRKFLLSLSGIFTVLGTQGFTSTAMWQIVSIIVAFCWTEAAVDVARARRGNSASQGSEKQEMSE